MCSSRLKINLPIATTFESVANPVAACEEKGGFRRAEKSGIQPRMKRFIRASALLIATVYCLTGCGKNPGTALEKSTTNYALPDPPLVANCEPGVPGGRLVIATYRDPKTFNPITQDESSSDMIIRHLFWALCNFDRVQQVVTPGLAESWNVAPDQKTWTFKLRKGLHWSDGEPLTADDVVFTFQALYETNSINVLADSQRVKGRPFAVTKVDDLTVQIVTPDVYAPFLESCAAAVMILPKHKLAAAVAAGKFDSTYGIDTPPADLVGSGPFRLKEYKPGELVLLERNPCFFEVDKNGTRLPYFDNIIYTIVPDVNAISLRFLKGECDLFEDVRPDEHEQFAAAAAAGKFRFLDLGYGLDTTFIWFNMDQNTNEKTGQPYVDPKKLKWFQQKNFRQAVSYAIDRDSIAMSIFAGRAEPNYDLVGHGNMKWFNPAIRAYPHDLEKARALLAEIGIKDRDGDGVMEDADGNPIEFVFNTETGNSTRNKMAMMIQSDLTKLGFKVIFQPVEFNTLVDRIEVGHNYDCILLGYHFSSLDPVVTYTGILISSAHDHDWNPSQKTPATPWEARMDELMNAQPKSFDFGDRKKGFDEVQMIFNDELPFIFTVTPRVYAAIRPDIGNLRPTPLIMYHVTWNAEELYFKNK
jgi:peptide/nickel transport system substrate-binding protein